MPNLKDLMPPRAVDSDFAYLEKRWHSRYHWSDSHESLPYIHLPHGVFDIDCPVLFVREDVGLYGLPSSLPDLLAH